MMKASKRAPTGEVQRPKAPGTRRPRSVRLPPIRLAPPRLSPQLSLAVVDESLRLWFDEEAEALQRLAHTQRLKGDYVAAQALEREIRVLAEDTHALLQLCLGGEE